MSTLETKIKEKEAAKQILLDEFRLTLDLNEKGIFFNAEELKAFSITDANVNGFSRNLGGLSFTLPHGIATNGKFARWTPYSIVVENGKPILYNDKKPLAEISFPVQTTHPVNEQLLSTGEKVKNIVGINHHGGLTVGYSTECALKDLGEDCLFCSINVRERDPNRPLIKNPRQVAEAYHLARQADQANHFRITGGFVPERRELEYYIDVAEAIRERYESFYGVAIIGAPADLSILPKYKEAGFTNISHNIEVWDKNLFGLVCPGKSKRNGGWQHWVDSLEAAVDTFGRGNVHTNIVGGLEPKEITLEGIEYLASKGIVAHFSVFRPEKGTPFEGYRSPEASFHWEIVDKATDIFLRYGFNSLQMYSGPLSAEHSGRVFRIKNGEFEGDKLGVYKYPSLDKKQHQQTINLTREVYTN